jgi:heme-degrading monooxygenase HmoA
VVNVIVSLVRFKSGLSDDEVEARFEERADRYRSVPGLMQKIYVRYRETGEHGAVYVWESEQAMTEFRESDLGRTISDTYQVQGQPQSELADVYFVVRPPTEDPVVSP